jgi:hypothetical protein
MKLFEVGEVQNKPYLGQIKQIISAYPLVYCPKFRWIKCGKLHFISTLIVSNLFLANDR